MGLTLPPELANLLSQAGGKWPQADEDALHRLAGSWRSVATQFRSAADETGRVSSNLAAQQYGRSIEAYLGHSSDVQLHLRLGASAADQTGLATDGMAKATLHTKTAMYDGLQKTHSQLRKAKRNRATSAVLGPIIGILLRTLGKFLWRIFLGLLKWIWRAIRWILRGVWWLLKKVVDFFKWLVRKGAGRAKSFPPKEAGQKIPKDWGKGGPTKKQIKQGKPGWRWRDPDNPNNAVRIDKGDPNHVLPSQRVDHVVVNSNGRIIGPDGKPIIGPQPSKTTEAHIPLTEWLKWKSWNHP